MVNDRHDSYEDEESEYQFSDDQINYELDPETKTDDTPQPINRKNFLAKITPYKRMIIGVVAFIVVLFIVFKVLSPGGSEAPPTDFAPNSTARPITPTPPSQQPPMPGMKQEVPATVSLETAPQPTPPSSVAQSPIPRTPEATNVSPVQTPTMAPPTSAANPSSPQNNVTYPPAQPGNTGFTSQSQLNMQAQQENGQMISQQTMHQQTVPQQTISQQPVPQQTMPQQTMLQQPMAPPTNLQPNQSQVASQGMPQVPTATVTIQAPGQPPAQVVPSNDVPPPPSLMQMQFAQKMAEYELQNKLLQEKMLILNKRLANMEATLNKMAQVVRDVRPRPAPSLPPARIPEPKMIYTVQAIIPGRAWLKSDTGETVTVAEGDILKDYGRIIKIDPYDGVVQIDNSRRIITLSYGPGND